MSSGGALRNISSNNTWSGPITLQSNSSVGVDADQLTISGAISGAFTLTKVGPGTLTLTNSSNSYNNTIVNGGFLLISNVAALPAGANVIVHDGGTLRFQNGFTGSRQLFLNGDGQGGAGAIDSVAGPPISGPAPSCFKPIAQSPSMPMNCESPRASAARVD